jgi:uncharacterized membrane protein YphA (DoxX/SURF4 family)
MSTVVEHVAWPPPAVHRHPPHVHGEPQPLLQPHMRPIVASPVLPAPTATPAIATTAAASTVTITAVLLPLRIFLAAGWLRAGIEKGIDHSWWNGTTLRGFLSDHHDMAVPFFRPVIDHVFAPYAVVVAALVVVAEIVSGLAIAIGRSMRAALRVGIVLNVAFILCGQVNPSAFYLIMEIALLLAIADGVLGGRPSTVNRRTLVYAGVAAVHGLALVPYVRTIDPAKVIADPAMMLAFLSLTVAATMLIRWIVANAKPSSAARTWTRRCSDWAHARRRVVD